MADEEQVLEVMREICQAFPRQNVNKQTAELYVQFLADLPVDLLREAATRHIATSIFFPTIAELRRLAASLAGTHPFDGQDATSLPDNLAYRAQALEDAFYEERILDPVEWEELAERFELADRSHRAGYTRKKLAALQAILEQETREAAPVE